MQTDWKQALFFPLITGAILLVFEYFFIQPWLRYKEAQVDKISGDSEQNQRKWVDWIRNAIINFKRIPNSHYQWSVFSIKQNFISISEMIIGGGQAEIIFSVTERYILDFSKPKEVSQYHMIIDRGGNIKRYKAISPENERPGVKILPFPVSWLVIGAILFAGIYSQLPKAPQQPIVPTVNGTPIPTLWSTAPQISVNGSPVNGSMGRGDVDTYIVSNAVGVLTIKVVPIDGYICDLFVYDTKNLLVRNGSTYYGEAIINLAPELNASYLLVVSPRYAAGGSYILSISTANNAP